jgi:hypothetical protein
MEYAKEFKQDTESFWDGVSKVYSASNMTHHMADFELSFILSKLKLLNVKGMACFGSADGNRDPIAMLKFLRENSLNLPHELTVNDISVNMVKEARKNLLEGGWHVHIENVNYVHKPLSCIDSIPSSITDKRMTYFIGVYNATYLKNSLILYRENKEIIGDRFMVSPLYYNQKECSGSELGITVGTCITFDIDKFEDVWDELDKMGKTPNFYAYSISTNKNFVSHYFDANCLGRLLNDIFTGYNVETVAENEQQNGARYIVNVITHKETSANNDYVITMLNNVLGNIKHDEHVSSLTKLRNLFG